MTPLTYQVIRDMRIAVHKRKSAYESYTDYITFKAYETVNPHVYWSNDRSFDISIFCEHNSHGEYFLELSPNNRNDTKKWFCFLRDGRYGKTFLHLKHISTFEQLQEIVYCLTDMKLCKNEFEAHEYLDNLENN